MSFARLRFQPGCDPGGRAFGRRAGRRRENSERRSREQCRRMRETLNFADARFSPTGDSHVHIMIPDAPSGRI